MSPTRERWMRLKTPDGVLVAIGLVVSAIGSTLPYARLATGDVTRDLTPWLLVVACLAATWLLAASRVGRWPAAIIALGLTVMIGYGTVAALRGLPTWAAVYHSSDATPGPALFLVAAGALLVAVGVAARVVRIFDSQHGPSR